MASNSREIHEHLVLDFEGKKRVWALYKAAFLERYDSLLMGSNSDSAYGLVLVELKLLGSIGFPKTVKQRAQYKFAEILRKGVTSANLVMCD